jgi:hypothetical protein
MSGLNIREAIRIGVAGGEASRIEGAGFSWPALKATAAIVMEGNTATMRLTSLHDSHGTGEIALTQLDVDGVSRLADIEDPVSPQLAATTSPGRVIGAGMPVSDATEPLEAGVTYLVTFKVTAASSGSAIMLGGAFAPRSLPLGSGVQNEVAIATGSAVKAFLNVTGDVTFEFVSLRKAEWVFPMLHRRHETIEDPDEVITRRFGNGGYHRPGEPLIPGETYELIYTVFENPDNRGLFSNSSPWGFLGSSNFSSAVGTHTTLQIVTAQEGSADLTGRLLRLDGNGVLTISYMSCRQVVVPAGRLIGFSIGAGELSASGTAQVPTLGAIYVSPTGSDLTGTGAVESPLRTPTEASFRSQPGDVIYLRPGLYPPLDVQNSGTEGNPITFTTLPGEERQGIIDGNLQPGSGVRISGHSWINVVNLTIRNCLNGSNRGIQIGNSSGTVGNILIEGNLIHHVNEEGIRCVGVDPGQYRAADNDIYVENVTIRGNEIHHAYQRQIDTNEVITIGGGVRNIIVEHNDVHDSFQYGINYKHGVDGGICRFNRIWNIQKWGLYMDPSDSYVRNVTYLGNIIWDCANGIVVAREPREVNAQNIIENVDIYNNVVFQMRGYGILLYSHSLDMATDPETGALLTPAGEITNLRVRFNTVYNARVDTAIGPAWNGAGEEIRMVDWSKQVYLDNSVVSGFEMIGNIIWHDPALRPTGPRLRDDFSGVDGFTVEDNLNFTTPRTNDPLFANPSASIVIPEGFTVGQDFGLPDFRLRDGSPAIGLARPEHTTAPFDRTRDGADRTVTRAAGAC